MKKLIVIILLISSTLELRTWQPVEDQLAQSIDVAAASGLSVFGCCMALRSIVTGGGKSSLKPFGWVMAAYFAQNRVKVASLPVDEKPNAETVGIVVGLACSGKVIFDDLFK